MAKRRPQVINSAGVSSELTSADLLHIAGGASHGVGFQSEGGIIQPRDFLADFIVQGFLTPVVASLTGTMSTSPWPGGSNVAIAVAAGHRVFKIVGDATLTFTYTASSDTYDDIDYNGTITHVAVANGAGVPAVTANSIRLQKVVTNGTQITSVSPVASLTGITVPPIGRYTSLPQTITVGGSLTLAHSLVALPRSIWYDLECVSAELNYTVGQRVSAQAVTGKNGAGPGLAIVADATNLNIRFNNGSPVFQVLNFTTGAQVNITDAKWKLIIYAEV